MLRILVVAVILIFPSTAPASQSCLGPDAENNAKTVFFVLADKHYPASYARALDQKGTKARCGPKICHVWIEAGNSISNNMFGRIVLTGYGFLQCTLIGGERNWRVSEIGMTFSVALD